MIEIISELLAKRARNCYHNSLKWSEFYMKERITKEKLELIRSFLRNHPDVVAAYGYGSGVMPQANSNNQKKDIDLILIVEDLLEYFHQNIKLNPNEYTKGSKKYFEKATVEKLEKGAPIAYLTHIPYQGQYFKTGVISIESFLSSCYERTSSYVPFRLEKPCATITCQDSKVEDAIFYDRQTTLMMCLLLLGEDEKTIHDLFSKICSISYLGDFRVKIKCEDPNKVNNIVTNQFDYFKEDYSAVNMGYYKEENGVLVVDYDAINRDLNRIPDAIKRAIHTDSIKESDLANISRRITEYYKKESERESLPQAMKGIQTAGIETAFTYALKKVKKGWQK